MQPILNEIAHPGPRRSLALAVGGGVLAALVVFMIYWPVRENGFFWDDWSVLDIDNSAGMRDPALWRETLLRPPADYSVLFRPLTMLTFVLQLWAGQSGPQPFHIVNLIIHSVNVLLLTLVAWHLLGDDLHRRWMRPAMAALCGLLYGVHPALIEPVVWISARSDLLLAFFLSLALLLDRTLAETGWKRALTIGASFLAAMLCKESAVGFLAALPIVHLAVSWRRPGPPEFSVLARALTPHYRVYIALLGALVLYFVARFAVSGALFGLEGVITPARYIDSFGQHVLVVIASMAYHVWSVLWPFQDIVPGRYLPLPINGMDVLPRVVASTGVIAVALVAVCSSCAGRVPALLFLAFAASLVPVVNIVPIPAVVIPSEVAAGSRYVTFPMIFACLAVPFVIRLTETSLMRYVRQGRALLWVVASAWILASIANVRVTIPLWSNDGTVNSWVIQQGGASSWRYAGVGVHYMRVGDYNRAREAFIIAIKLRDDKLTAWIWSYLAVAEAALGHLTQAVQAYRRAVELDADDMRARINLSRLELVMGNSRVAVEMLEEALRYIQRPDRIHKQEILIRHELGLSYARLGRASDAAEQLDAALKLARSSRERKTIEQALSSISPR